MTALAPKRHDLLAGERSHTSQVNRQHLVVAHLWPKSPLNLGTIMRTCDAVGASIATPQTANAWRNLRRGDTLGVGKVYVEAVAEPTAWLSNVIRDGYKVAALELTTNALDLRDVGYAYDPTVLLIGNEGSGIPRWAMHYADYAIEIPMHGVGHSLNVSVATALALYKMAGLT